MVLASSATKSPKSGSRNSPKKRVQRSTEMAPNLLFQDARTPAKFWRSTKPSLDLKKTTRLLKETLKKSATKKRTQAKRTSSECIVGCSCFARNHAARQKY